MWLKKKNAAERYFARANAARRDHALNNILDDAYVLRLTVDCHNALYGNLFNIAQTDGRNIVLTEYQRPNVNVEDFVR